MDSARFRPERTAPAPVLSLVRVLRARVVGDSRCLEVCDGLARRRCPWAQVAGFDVPDRGFVRLPLTGGERVPLTALPRRDLPRLIALGKGAA